MLRFRYPAASSEAMKAWSTSWSASRSASSSELEAVAGALAARGVFASHGDFYATTVVERLGLGEEGLVRAGCACYTTEDEIDRLIEAIRELNP